MRGATALVREGYAFPHMKGGVPLYHEGPAMRCFLADWALNSELAGRSRYQVTSRDLLWRPRFCALRREFSLRRVTASMCGG